MLKVHQLPNIPITGNPVGLHLNVTDLLLLASLCPEVSKTVAELRIESGSDESVKHDGTLELQTHRDGISMMFHHKGSASRVTAVLRPHALKKRIRSKSNSATSLAIIDLLETKRWPHIVNTLNRKKVAAHAAIAA